MTPFIVCAFFVFGSLIGSFLNVVILRLPKGQTLFGRSACPSCGTELGFYDLVPVFSYIALGGKCRYCKTKISPRYWLIELITAAIFALVAYHFFSGEVVDYLFLAKWLLACALFIVIFVIDLEHFLILDKVIVVGTIIMLALNFMLDSRNHNWLSFQSISFLGLLAGAAACAFFFAIWFVSKGRWMGFGDVKLVFLLGLIVGWPLIFVMLLLAFWLGALVSVPLLFSGKKSLESALPFGTFLTGAAFLTLFWGQTILAWYLHLTGW